MQPFRELLPGGKRTAKEENRLAETVYGLSRVQGTTEGDGARVIFGRDGGPLVHSGEVATGFWARLTGKADDPARYAWRLVIEGPPGTWTEGDALGTSDPDGLPAREINGADVDITGSPRVWLWPSETGRGYLFDSRGGGPCPCGQSRGGTIVVVTGICVQQG